MKAPTLRIDEAIDFLRRLQGRRTLIAICPMTGKIHAATPANRLEVVSFLRKYHDLKWGIYFAVNCTFGPMQKKPTKDDVARFNAAHVELDPTGKSSPDWHERTRAKLKGSQWPPSVIWSSGNGEQALWLMPEPIKLPKITEFATEADILDRAEKIARCEAKNHGLLASFTDSEIKFEGTWNIDRILRLPGTVNRPNKKKIALGRISVEAGNVEWL